MYTGMALSQDLSKLRVIDLIVRDPVTIDSEASIVDVANKMIKEKVGSIIVTVDGIPKGIITEGDIVKKVVAKNLKPSEVKARDIMSTPLQFVLYDATLEEAVRIMDENNISHLAVFKNDKLIGVITSSDILHIAPSLIEYLKVRPRGGKII
ncbi:hypothetical protein IPA_04505 [Ignicoccus pacificus DSM 13166]|uniref:CBS domain-containing protein n=1 Tax=Ignicoccus pacificus DSM 13166 TaxID=940294 RepID=A0A977KAS8_9CREN|nr:hypothetical protein IPA_04505 [Ignicoccus pacificus DSM 13166]